VAFTYFLRIYGKLREPLKTALKNNIELYCLIPAALTIVKLQKQLQLFYTYNWYKVMCKILCK